jgi:hypothetical protein
VARIGHTPEQIVHKLRGAEAAQTTGSAIGGGCRQIGLGEQTYYRRRASPLAIRASESVITRGSLLLEL